MFRVIAVISDYVLHCNSSAVIRVYTPLRAGRLESSWTKSEEGEDLRDHVFAAAGLAPEVGEESGAPHALLPLATTLNNLACIHRRCAGDITEIDMVGGVFVSECVLLPLPGALVRFGRWMVFQADLVH